MENCHLLLLLAWGVPGFAPAASVAEPLKDKPNVVLIYGDDVGFADVGVHGSVKVPTPNIDRLAREGLRFTDGHAIPALPAGRQRDAWVFCKFFNCFISKPCLYWCHY